MIEGILAIPDEVLKAQLGNKGDFKGEEFLVVFLDDDFNIDKIEKGTYEKICEKNPDLSDLQKDLIINFQEYRGVIAFGKDCNRYAFGGNQALATCSLLHYRLSSETIHKNLFEKKTSSNLDNILDKINLKTKANYSQLIKDHKDLTESFKKILKNLFTDIILEKRNYRELEFDKFRIVLIPKRDDYIEKYNTFWGEFIDVQSRKTKDEKQNFNLDTFSSDQTSKHGVLFSKFGKEKTFQKDEYWKINLEDYEKIRKFKEILKKEEFKNVLPLPLFEADSNIYSICFSSNSLLKKLQEIYQGNNNQPFNYVLISNREGYRFENIINYNFDIASLINPTVYNLKFNELRIKNEFKKINNPERAWNNKYELLFDILSLFWIIKNEENNDYRQMSFFSPEIRNNAFLDQILKSNSESIINQIFKNDNQFINFRLQKIINSILNEVLHHGETQKQFSSFYSLKKLLLLSLKYERKKEKMKSEETKIIEEKLDNFKKKQELTDIKSDFEAYFYAGLIFKHLVSVSASGKSNLEIASTYLLSIATTKQLKEKIAFLTTQYSHSLRVSPKMWNLLNKLLLEYDFSDDKLKNNLIPFFIGYYTDFWLSQEKQEDLSNTNEDE